MISIIVPIYNVEKYLAQCIESLINQTYKDIEIILVDDGSPDKCPEICDSYAQKDRRIHVIHKTNGGESSARNAGLRAANGVYIGFVDPDDWISFDMYENMSKALIETQADLAVCGYHYCHENGSIDKSREYNRRSTEVLSQRDVMRRCSDIPPTIRHVVWNKLFHRKFLQGLLFDESLTASMDVKLLTEYLLKIQKAVFLHEPYYFNRVRPGSATHGGLSIHNLVETYVAHEYMHHVFVDTYPDLQAYSQAFLLDVYLLKYNEAKQRAKNIGKKSQEDASDLKRMKKTIHKEGLRAVFNREIYWKTRLAYLLVR